MTIEAQQSELLSEDTAQLAQGNKEAIAEGAPSMMTILPSMREIRMRFGQEFPARGSHGPQRRNGRRCIADLGEGSSDFLPDTLQRSNDVVWNFQIIVNIQS